MTGCLSMLARLGRDNAGNTLAIAAASLIPLMALIGGGVDVSRAYMAKTELQSACDAGVLAGRKAMSKSGSYGDTEKAKATSMFNFNFNANSLNVTDLSYETDDNADGQVLGTATATLPTLVMKIFDKDTVELSVDCMAELQIGNADVMFVLDNTTSMNCAPEDTASNCTQYGVNDSRSKFYGLKEAVKDFHKTINQAVNDNRTRIRYGFVPYAMTVNATGLLSSGSLPTSYISDVTDYRTRLAQFNTPIYIAGNTSTVNTTETYSSNITRANCETNSNNYGNNKYPSGSAGTPINGGGPAPASTTVTSYSFQSWTKVSGNGSSAVGTCKRNKSVVTTPYSTQYQFTRWVYQSDEVSTSNFRNRTATRYATGVTTSTTVGSTSRATTAGTYDMVELAAMSQAGTVTGVSTTNSTGATWNGCIEERATETPSSTYDFDPIPASAYDLDLDTVPSSKATRWKPMWHSMYIEPASWSSYYFKQADGKFYQNSGFTGSSVSSVPSNSNPSAYCPAQMKLFETVTLADDPDDIPTSLSNYLATLNPSGYTYHDIGLIWGGRLSSPTGLFQSNVNLDADKINVSRHIIFMTDGILQPEADEYSAWGQEQYDHRIAPSGSEGTIYNRHMARFVAMCDRIKSQGTTIWVVAFGVSMTNELRNCATDGRAYYSSNTTALRNTFKYIAAQVADLRLGA